MHVQVSNTMLMILAIITVSSDLVGPSNSEAGRQLSTCMRISLTVGKTQYQKQIIYSNELRRCIESASSMEIE